LLSFLMKANYVLTVPISTLLILGSRRIHPAYRMNLLARLSLGFRMFLNTRRIRTGTSYKTHLAMALKLLETPPEVPGDVVECGTWKGGCATNLSLICRIVGRKLRIYDSFAGLPEGKPGDREAAHYREGDYRGTLEEVKANIARYGAIECCTFIQGWFDRTLPGVEGPLVLVFLDVDLEDSLVTCVRHLWPALIDQGYVFLDEVVVTDYCALFYSERFWKQYFDRTPPGLIGAGVGLALGDYYIGPVTERDDHPGQFVNAGAWTRKDMSGVWTYYPDEA
jgi:O-methyltransferase